MIETNLKGTTFVISNEREGLEANFGRCILRKIIKIFIFERERERTYKSETNLDNLDN